MFNNIQTYLLLLMIIFANLVACSPKLTQHHIIAFNKHNELIKKANQNDKEAQLKLALIYKKSNNTTKVKQSFVWFLSLANQGNLQTFITVEY